MNYGTFMVVDDVERLEEHLYFPILTVQNFSTLLGIILNELEILKNLKTREMTNNELEFLIRIKTDFRFFQYQHTFDELEQMFKNEKEILEIKNQYSDYRFQVSKIISVGEVLLAILKMPTKSFINFLELDRVMLDYICITDSGNFSFEEVSFLALRNINEEIECRDYESLKTIGVKTMQCRIDDIINYLEVYYIKPKNIKSIIDIAENIKIFISELFLKKNIEKLSIDTSKINEFTKSVKELQDGLDYFLTNQTLWADKWLHETKFDYMWEN